MRDQDSDASIMKHDDCAVRTSFGIFWQSYVFACVGTEWINMCEAKGNDECMRTRSWSRDKI